MLNNFKKLPFKLEIKLSEFEEGEIINELFVTKTGYGHENWACNFINTIENFSAGTLKTFPELAKNNFKLIFKCEENATIIKKYYKKIN